MPYRQITGGLGVVVGDGVVGWGEGGGDQARETRWDSWTDTNLEASAASRRLLHAKAKAGEFCPAADPLLD